MNLNIFYDPNYWLNDRKIYSKNIFQSSLFNVYYKYLYRYNIPLNSNFVRSGPQKLVNNILEGLNGLENVVFNDEIYDNNYFVTYQKKDSDNLINILNKAKKVVVGPLYNIESYLELASLSNNYDNLKIVVASTPAKKTMLKISNFKIDESKLLILPVGVDSEENILKNGDKQLNDNHKCLIYFKGRTDEELNVVVKRLDNDKTKYKIFQYGAYKNSKLIDYAKTAKFAIILGRTESQGIAINKLMSMNVPLFVLDATINNYEGLDFAGTTVPYWSKECGIRIKNFDNFHEEYDKFKVNLENNYFYPYKYASKELSYEAMYKNLKNIFKNTFS